MKRRKSGVYVYSQKRNGVTVGDEYIGKENDPYVAVLLQHWDYRQKLIEEFRDVNQQLRVLHERSKLKLEFTDEIRRMLKALSESGAFNDGLEIVGSWCYRIYQTTIGVEQYPLRTNDMDFAVREIRLPAIKSGINIGDILKQLGFRENFYGNGVVFYEGAGLKIEFLTPEKGKGSRSGFRKIPQFHISGQPLRFLNMLTDSVITVDVRGIGKVVVPEPAAFALHKLIVAQRRPIYEADKKQKDMIQAFFVMKKIFQKTGSLDSIKKLANKYPPKWINKADMAILQLEAAVPATEKHIAKQLADILLGNRMGKTEMAEGLKSNPENQDPHINSMPSARNRR